MFKSKFSSYFAVACFSIFADRNFASICFNEQVDSFGFSLGISKASNALCALLNKKEKITGNDPSERRSNLLSFLYPLADRKNREIFDNKWHQGAHFYGKKESVDFIKKAFPKKELTLPSSKEGSIILVVPGAHARRILKRFSIANDACVIAKEQGFNVSKIVNIVGYREIGNEEKKIASGIFNLNSQVANKLDTEEKLWAYQHDFVTDKFEFPKGSIGLVSSNIYPSLYQQGNIPKRSTTFDNAAAFVQWAKKLGDLKPNDVIVLCIEEPFSERMLLIFKTIIGWYLPNTVVVFNGKDYEPSIDSLPTNSDGMVDLSSHINQVYLRIKLYHEIKEDIIWPSIPLLKDLENQILPTPGSNYIP